jgi:hypothetical protein
MARGQRKAGLTVVDSSEPVQNTNVSLRNEVKESLLSILRDPDASAAAKASAGRTLLEYFDDSETTSSTRRGADMNAAELDAAIAAFGD